MLVLACAHSPVVHEVAPGETLYRISHHYGVSVTEIMAENGLDDPNQLHDGQRLTIPETDRGAPDAPLLAPAGIRPAEDSPLDRKPWEPGAWKDRDELRRLARDEAIVAGGLQFAWPLHARMSSPFGRRNGRMHQGLDLAAPRGTPIRAAEAGHVLYSGDGLGAYGNVVIVRHKGGFDSVYAHNKKNKTRKGKRVKKGQVIAEVGRSGNATGNHLHFEIRRNGRSRDPLLYLP